MRRQQLGGGLLSLILVVSVIALGGGAGVVAADETVADDVETVNNEYIPIVNTLVEEANSEFENVDHVEKTDPVEAETREEAIAEADRLRGEIDRYPEDILGSAVEEINIQANDIIGQDLITNEVNTPDDARAEADRIEDEWGQLAEEAYEALREVADGLEAGEDALNSAIFILEGGAVGTVEGGPVEDAAGEPLEGVTVSIEDGPSTTTDANGMFTITGVPEGEHTIIFHGAEEETDTVTVSEGQETEVGGVVLEADAEVEDDDDGLLFGSLILDIGAVISILTIVGGLAFAGVGAMTHQREETLEIDALELSLTVEDFQAGGKAVGFFVAAGLAIGIAAFFSVGWVVYTFAEEALPLGDLAQLVALVIVFLVGPALGIIYGMTEGREGFSRERSVRTTVATLVGTVLLVVVAMVIIGFASPGEGADVAAWDAIAIAGLVGLVSAIGSAVGLAITNRPSLEV